jgi:hypothetical protein
MSDNSEIMLDEKSGISIEEQKEILSTINGIAEKHRRSLSNNMQSSEKNKINAKKSGIIFPATINITAIIILCTGAFFLIYINALKDIQIRTSAAGFNLVLAGVQHETSEELALARKELELLTTERELIDRVDSHISGGLVNISLLIGDNKFDQAKERVQHWQNYLSIDLIASSPAFQSRKENYEELLIFINTLIDDAEKQLDLIELAADQEETIINMQTTIETLEVQKDTLNQTIVERDSVITTHVAAIVERDNSISSLRNQNSVLEGTVTNLSTQIGQKNQEIEELKLGIQDIIGN